MEQMSVPVASMKIGAEDSPSFSHLTTSGHGLQSVDFSAPAPSLNVPFGHFVISLEFMSQ